MHAMKEVPHASERWRKILLFALESVTIDFELHTGAAIVKQCKTENGQKYRIVNHCNNTDAHPKWMFDSRFDRMWQELLFTHQVIYPEAYFLGTMACQSLRCSDNSSPLGHFTACVNYLQFTAKQCTKL